MRTPLKIFRDHRQILHQLTIRGIRTRYAASMLGLCWAMITPIVMLCIYTFVFSVIFQVRWGDIGESKLAFALVLLCGLTIYNIFSETVSQCTRVIVSNTNYVKRVIFPLEVLPVSVHFVSCALSLFWFLLIFVGVFVFMGRFCYTAICLPLILAPLSLFTLGISWLVASLGVYVRDMPHFIDIVLRALFFLTPIFYTPDRVPLPYRYVFYINPLGLFINQLRRILIFNQWPQWYILLPLFIGSAVVAQLGYLWFMRTRKGFADVL